MSPTVENIGSQPPCFWRVYKFQAKCNLQSPSPRRSPILAAAPIEPLATPSTTMARESKVWLGNGLPLRCNILRAKWRVFTREKKKTSDSSEGKKKRASSHDVHIAIYLHEHMYTVYMCKHNIVYICMGELQSYCNISPIFKLPRSQEIVHIFPQSPRDSPKVFPRTATWQTGLNVQVKHGK